MNIDCLITPLDVRNDEKITLDHTVVVIDILRVSSTIVTAMESGAERIYPVFTASGAFERKESLILEGISSDMILLGGERNGVRVEGFDMGNSPFEYSTDRVGGKTLVLSSTNGTRVMTRCTNAGFVLAGSFLNRRATALAAVRIGKDLILYLSGREGTFSFEDAAGAGGIIDAVISASSEKVHLTDAARMCLELFKTYETTLPELLSGVNHGRYLSSIGYEKDLAYCAELDVVDVVPFLCEEGFFRRY